MRNIFLALVLANLAFAAWHFWYGPGSPPPASVPEDGPPITLVSEAPPGAPSDARAPPLGAAERLASRTELSSSAEPSASAAAEPPAAAFTPAAAAAGVALPVAEGCVSVGPFRELAQAANAAATLRAAGHSPTQRVAEGDVWVGYWVYLERIATESEAAAMLANIREHGVTDSYVIPDDDGDNRVSLGVFTEISRAGRRREEVRALGYEPVVTDRTRRDTVYWVDVELGPGQALDFDALQTPGRILRLEQRSCPPA